MDDWPWALVCLVCLLLGAAAATGTLVLVPYTHRYGIPRRGLVIFVITVVEIYWYIRRMFIYKTNIGVSAASQQIVLA